MAFIINDHNFCCQISSRIDEKMKILIAIYYYVSVPFMGLLLICVLLDEINANIRFVLLVFLINSCLVLLYLAYAMSLVPIAAISPYQRLNSIITRKTVNINLKLKVFQLIEKLSGPVIGFYCYEFFPFTNYEIYIYVVNCVMYFILFRGLM